MKTLMGYGGRVIIIADAQKAADLVGGIADLEDDLVEEVTSLVEWPVVLTATFEEKFLKACINNQIPKIDQVEKLREVLNGKANSQVPDRTENTERVWELV